jgi:glycosyltransferase involved in cell wall biosynthesis
VQREQAFREACRAATALAAISDYSRDAAIAYGAAEPARVRTIALRLARERGDAGPRDVGARFGLAPGRYLLYPANFWRHKNHEMLLTAFGMARRAGLPADMKLLFTGAPDPRGTWLAAMSGRLGLGDAVVFAGFVSADELASLMAHANGVVFPSLYEGFGLPVAEAMALGVPVACSNTTALPEVAGEAALLFDPRLPGPMARALVSLSTDAPLRASLVAAGARRARAFTDADRMTREYLELFAAAQAAPAR